MPRNTDSTREVKTFIYRDEYAEIKAYADARGISVADLLRDALREHLRRNGVKLPLLVRRGKRLPDAPPPPPRT